jgi:hypothetical protein
MHYLLYGVKPPCSQGRRKRGMEGLCKLLFNDCLPLSWLWTQCPSYRAFVHTCTELRSYWDPFRDSSSPPGFHLWASCSWFYTDHTRLNGRDWCQDAPTSSQCRNSGSDYRCRTCTSFCSKPTRRSCRLRNVVQNSGGKKHFALFRRRICSYF